MAPAAQLSRLLCPRAPACLGACQARHRRGDTVSVLLANTPAMLECHYGVPMTGAVLNTINTRLDAAMIAFSLDHAETKVLIVDREFSGVMKDALARTKVKPLVIHYDDPRICGRRASASARSTTRISDGRRSGFRLGDAGRRMGRDLAQLHLWHHRRSEGRGVPPSRRLSARARQCRDLQMGRASGLSVDAADVPLQWLVLPLVDLGVAGTHVCLRQVRAGACTI